MKASRWLRWIFKSLTLTVGDNIVTTPLLGVLGSLIALDSVAGMVAGWALGNAPYLGFQLASVYLHGGAEDV